MTLNIFLRFYFKEEAVYTNPIKLQLLSQTKANESTWYPEEHRCRYLPQVKAKLKSEHNIISTSSLSADLQSTLLYVGETKMNMAWLLYSELSG